MLKPPKSGFKTALTAILKTGKHAGNPAHLEKWLAEADDPIWEQIASEARASGRRDSYTLFIAAGIAVHHIAEVLGVPHSQMREEQRGEQRQATELRALANKIDEVIRDHKRVQRYKHYQMGMRALASTLKLKVQESFVSRLDLEAQMLRKFANAKLTDEYSLFENTGVRVSRMGRAKKKGGRSRGITVFSQLMVQMMRFACGRAHHEAVAKMANIFFADEGASIDADDIAAACKPTTRAGRERKTVL